MRAWIFAAVLGLSSTSAYAGEFDFRLNADAGGQGVLFSGLSNGQCAPRCTPNNAAWRDLTTQLGYIVAPRIATPAETLGHAGFHLGLMWSGTSVSAGQEYWQVQEAAQRTGNARGFAQTLQLDLRKGLPFSFELGVNFMWLVDSEMFAPGLEVGWALQEGYRFVPDLSLRAAVNHMVGNRDLLLTTLALGAVLSKSFSVSGVINFTPYAGWSVILISANSRVIDPTPLVEGDLDNDFVFADREIGDDINHRLTVGLRTLYYILNVSVQGEFQLLSNYETGGSGVFTITTKLGLDF